MKKKLMQKKNLITFKKIPLYGKGGILTGHAIVDAVDYPRLIRYRWNKDSSGYARTTLSVSEQILMHRLVLNFPKGKNPQIDHINRNKLDNRKANLRSATYQLNARNRGLQRNNKSGYRGVYFRSRIINGKKYEYWVACIGLNGKHKEFGYHKTIGEAVKARKIAEQKLWN